MFRRACFYSATIAFMSFVCSGVSVGSEREGRIQGRGDPQKAPRGKLEKYQVPAGTVLRVLLVTGLDSAKSKVNDQVDAALVDAVRQDGTELIPAKSVMLGKVVKVTPASRRNPLGEVALTFSVIEHLDTRSLASIETDSIVLTATPDSPDEDGRRPRKQPKDIRVDPAQLLIVRLAEPLIVYIPRTD